MLGSLNEYERQRAVLSADCATPAGKGVAFGHCFPSFFPALRAYKVKGKVETFLKKSFIKKLYACSPKVYLSFQMSRSYSATERSEEKYPALAIFTSIFLAQAARSS